MSYALARGKSGTFQMTTYRAFALIMLSQVMWYFLGEGWERLYRQSVHGTDFQTGNSEYARVSTGQCYFLNGWYKVTADYYLVSFGSPGAKVSRGVFSKPPLQIFCKGNITKFNGSPLSN